MPLTNDEVTRLAKHIDERARYFDQHNPFVKTGILPSKRYPRAGNDSRYVVKTGFLKSETVINDDNSMGSTYLYPNAAFIERLKQEGGKEKPKTFGRLRVSVDFEQHRAGILMKKFSSLDDVHEYQERLENIFLLTLLAKGIDGNRLHRSKDNELVITKTDQSNSQDASLSSLFKSTLAFYGYTRYENDEIVDFGTATRSIMPDALRRMNLHYFYDQADDYRTVFAFPCLDIGKLGFHVFGQDDAPEEKFAEFFRVRTNNGREYIDDGRPLTFEQLRNNLLRLVSDACAEAELTDREFINSFFREIDEMRENLSCLPSFTPGNLSTAHQDIIPRVQ